MKRETKQAERAFDAEAIDQTIRSVCIRRLGVVDTSIVRYVERSHGGFGGGTWYLLFIRKQAGEPSQLLGRRATKAELLVLAETLNPRHVDGIRFAA